MRKPPSGAEFCTKTPTVKDEPNVTGIFGAPMGQLVAVEELVMHTSGPETIPETVAP
jgi:hypothetical protein